MGHIFLYGPPACGKSSVGEVLAKNLNRAFIDLDEIIKQATGKDIPELVAEKGEAVFRDIESAELMQIILNPDSVIALGGGTLLRAENRTCVESAGVIVFLEVSFPILIDRLSRDPNRRPLLAGDLTKKLTTLLNHRTNHYASFPHRIELNNKSISEAAWQIQIGLGRFHLRAMGSGYDVIVLSDGLDSLGEMLQVRSLENPIIVTDENVGKIHGERAVASLRHSKYNPQSITVPAGESSKTQETMAILWRGFLAAGLDRKSTVIALGGGVIGDMAGFAAATFMRGIDWVVVPTSLVSMVDASLGGKTGFDLPEGKNLIGSFYSPRLVLADPLLLRTIPETELISGMAEVVKHGVIADPDLFEFAARGLDSVKENLHQIVRRGMAVKIKIIEEDPFEEGFRAALNLGHTVGHAVETVSGFRIRHGEAVAMGMVAEAKLSENLGIASKGLAIRISEALSLLELPIEIPRDLAREGLIQAMRFDKKKAAGMTRFSLPVDIGRVNVNVGVKDLELLFKEN